MGVLANQPEFPVISLSLADGEAVQDLLVDSEIEASIKLTLENLPFQNVIAQKPGASDAVVVLGGHFDSVPGLSGQTTMHQAPRSCWPSPSSWRMLTCPIP